MRKLFCLGFLPILLGLSSFAFADFNGPAPLAWRWAQPSSIPPTGSAVVDGNTIYVSVGTRVFALDRDTGNQKWKFPTTEDIHGYFQTNPVVCDGVVVAATDSTLYGLDPETGVQKWYYKLQDPKQGITAQPIVADKDVVFEVSGEYLVAIDGSTGKDIWPAQQHVFELLKGNLGALGDTVYYFNQNNQLCSFNVNSPTKVKTLVTFSTLSESATPVIDSDILYVNSNSYVAALNAYTGTTRWETDTQEDLVYGPAVSPDSVAAVSRDGILTIMDLRGHIKTLPGSTGRDPAPMKIDLQSGAAARPTAAGKFFLVPTLNGSIDLVDSTTGAIAWQYLIHPMSAEDIIVSGRNMNNNGFGNRGGGGGPGTGMGPGGGGGGPRGGGGPGVPGGAGGGSGTQAASKQYTNLLVPDAADYSIPVAGPVVVSGNSLFVLAGDGSLLAFDKTTGVDATGPEVKLENPAAGSDVSSQDLGVAFRITDDNSGVDDRTIAVTVNGHKVAQTFTADGLDTVRFSMLGDNKPLPDGRADFLVTVSDWMGNVTKKHFVLIIDNSLPSLAAPPQTGNQGAGGRFGGGGGGGGYGGGGRGYGGGDR